MIVTHIFGGLGNQLFQLATGIGLSERLGVELRMDTRYFDKPRPDVNCLGHFNHRTLEADRRGLPAMRHDGLLPYLAAKMRGSDWPVYQENSMAFDAAVNALPDGSYLKGYWQCEKYFSDQAEAVRDRLGVLTPPTPENIITMAAQDVCFPVSLHIRRGDYVTNAKFNAVHGTCDLDYYSRAADYIASNTDQDITFFCFSDDPDWVEENLKLPYKMKIMRDNGVALNYEDIRLMSRCKHHIVANSSFSWWGAWLNPEPEKIVVAPKQWFADPRLQDHDLVPEDWVEI